MAQQEKITTRDGQVQVTIIPNAELSVDRILEYLIKNSFSSDYARVSDGTGTIPKDVKDLLITEVEKK
jgi:hypothetical protein